MILYCNNFCFYLVIYILRITVRNGTYIIYGFCLDVRCMYKSIGVAAAAVEAKLKLFDHLKKGRRDEPSTSPLVHSDINASALQYTKHNVVDFII